MTADPAATYERLRIETAAMLNLDAAGLSLVENLQLDLVSLLRLEIDALQGQVLSGAQVDLARLSTALGMLRQLLPERALVAPAPPPEVRFGPNARERLRRLIEATVLAPAIEGPDEIEHMRDIRDREEQAAIAAAALDLPTAAPTPSAPAPVAPQPPQQTSPQPPLLPPDAPIPANYLASPWRAASERDRWSPPRRTDCAGGNCGTVGQCG